MELTSVIKLSVFLDSIEDKHMFFTYKQHEKVILLSYNWSDYTKTYCTDEHYVLYLLKKLVLNRINSYRSRFNKIVRKFIINECSFCWVCNSKEKLTVDHILPISKGGFNTVGNIQILCNICNIIKNNK